jgi:hypothetical protein
MLLKYEIYLELVFCGTESLNSFYSPDEVQVDFLLKL